MLTLDAMPKDAPETDTVPVTIRMDRKKRDRLLAFGKRFPFKLTLTQLIDAATDEYLANHDPQPGDTVAAPKRPTKPK